MGDNGTPELNELEKKQKAFADNPDDFVSVSDLIIAVKRGKEQGQLDTLVSPSTRVELEISLMRLTHNCFGVFNAMSHAQQQVSKPVIQAPGGIMNFARNRFKK